MSGKPAARVTDPTSCPLPGHGVNPIAAGSSDVLFDGLAAARQGDQSACGSPIVGEVASTVLINGKPAATVGSIGAHGNSIVSGSGTVIIGNAHTPAAFTPPAAMPLWAMVFDEQFRIVGSDGQPLANVPYHIKDETGRVYTGFSDASGHTPRIATSKQETLEVTTGVAALEKWSEA
ncbi:PAAR domain-containing protein [Pseudomonas sp. SK3(2021)]|uniref:PAAR domain-containing protein n=1 Tax=Pseudomonas sp. SK3(2021) TaxID=2841064 RepID=UPI00192A7F02|nr:PAAR domain-containing protein [Pseudomonas sp. SK3(2021)]QQZ44196.1 PAAR domain-containing protein [Pseudomonas sp. SK3(2021)]